MPSLKITDFWYSKLIFILADNNTILLAAAFKKNHTQQKFIAFEPEKNNFLMLKKNCEINYLSFVECYQKGLGEHQGYLNLNISTNSNRMIHSFLSRPGTQTADKVEVSTLDAIFFDRPQYLSPSLLKIDVEGYENQVIKGGLKWFCQLDNLAIICEVTPYLL
ncbi:MAG: FkbM family methyltransferase [Okeania sp. SIO1H6]|uniref:FkbM family methyltransferase n=1 Tax=Okeania hirsuta TaxID=1458930 RepID=A0A3N6PBW5_9CYAN|nr:FkbM family methyltransferase [Okeania sp. SIO1H4]NET15026.1 FkbM family methyltransferase [Okeania sp. SIO1H6]NET23398.1 FkbM family methyltransferase [Okeania sp. SIO1H5]NET78638.1 FkbM family methyltransferase [Okeania sp. SIO1F9]NET97093.1 FkbM family methyltransferase [Okeania sp. SIO1H2]RQH26058.1 FkbM family methyltransferase [Okeania hirsuta]